MSIRHYYADTAGSAPALPTLHTALDADVCVVGGGFAGLNTVLGLAERGHRDVVLLEAEQPAFGASGRNGGFVFGGFSRGEAALLRDLGRERARALRHVGAIYEAAHFYDYLTGWQNLRALCSLSGWWDEAEARRVLDLVNLGARAFQTPAPTATACASATGVPSVLIAFQIAGRMTTIQSVKMPTKTATSASGAPVRPASKGPA